MQILKLNRKPAKTKAARRWKEVEKVNRLEIYKKEDITQIIIDGNEMSDILSYKLEQNGSLNAPTLTIVHKVSGDIKIGIQ